MQQGFTLLELSIVLVIIGLIIGGVTVGQDLIRSAELNSVISEANKFKTATNTFKLKYNALPGDMDNATAYWGDQATGTSSCADGTITDGSPGTCNGNGDGKVMHSAEGYRYWQHLTLAEILNINVTGYNGPAGVHDHVIDVNVPGSAITGAGWWVAYRESNASWAEFFNRDHGNHLILGVDTVSGLSYLYNGAVTPAEAYSIDSKVDDGIPGNGKILGRVSGCSTGTFNNFTAPYDLDNDAVGCFVIYANAF